MRETGDGDWKRETLSATAATTTTCGRLWSSVVVGSDHYYFFYVYCLSTFEECAWSNGDGGTSPSGLAPSLSWFARGAGTDSSACSVSQCGTTLPTLWPWPPVFQPQSLSLSPFVPLPLPLPLPRRRFRVLLNATRNVAPIGRVQSGAGTD